MKGADCIYGQASALFSKLKGIMKNEASKIRERRLKVFRLRQEGLNQSQIAVELDCLPQIVSKDLEYLNDLEILRRMIDAEQPLALTGDAGVDGLLKQAKSLQQAQARIPSTSADFLRRSEAIGWHLL